MTKIHFNKNNTLVLISKHLSRYCIINISLSTFFSPTCENFIIGQDNMGIYYFNYGMEFQQSCLKSNIISTHSILSAVNLQWSFQSFEAFTLMIEVHKLTSHTTLTSTYFDVGFLLLCLTTLFHAPPQLNVKHVLTESWLHNCNKKMAALGWFFLWQCASLWIP